MGIATPVGVTRSSRKTPAAIAIIATRGQRLGCSGSSVMRPPFSEREYELRDAWAREGQDDSERRRIHTVERRGWHSGRGWRDRRNQWPLRTGRLFIEQDRP